uniref:Uncharacterized protein n=1 Tax=Ascaris lumbricoides TaxID=6252 RepID=A0A0M3HWU1_ASCLU
MLGASQKSYLKYLMGCLVKTRWTKRSVRPALMSSDGKWRRTCATIEESWFQFCCRRENANLYSKQSASRPNMRRRIQASSKGRTNDRLVSRQYAIAKILEKNQEEKMEPRSE